MIRERLADRYDDGLLFLDPPESFDRCIVGVAERCGLEPVVVYDRRMVIDSLMLEGMDREEAEGWFSFNTSAAYVGPRTPVFLDRCAPFAPEPTQVLDFSVMSGAQEKTLT